MALRSAWLAPAPAPALQRVGAARPAPRPRPHARAAAEDARVAGNVSPIPPRVPRSLADVDGGATLGFAADLAPDHPGFGDAAYVARRRAVAALARGLPLDAPIPEVAYSREEQATWARVVGALAPLHARHACAEYLAAAPRFAFRADAVPQLAEMGAALRAATGWRVRPTAGLLHPRDFLAGLAFRCFHSTQYVRHASRPDYTPEPDLVHEAIGHVPMLADPGFCALARGVGAAALGADDAAVWALAKVYWFTVEFGVVMEGNVPKAFGAGILSSVAEMENLAAGGAEIVPFDPFQPLPKMSYRDGVQRRYHALESFDAGAARLQEYCEFVRARLPPARRAAVEAALEEADAAAARRRGGAGAARAR